MALMDLFRPKWRHSNADVRLAAVAELEDQAVLADIAQYDLDTRVRQAAVRKVESHVVLAQIATKVWNKDVRLAATEKVEDQVVLTQIAMKDQDDEVRRAAAARITDPVKLRALEANALDGVVGSIAGRILEEARVEDVACKQDQPQVRQDHRVNVEDRNRIFREAMSLMEKEDVAGAIRINRLALIEHPGEPEFWNTIAGSLYQFVGKNLVPFVGSDTRILAILADSDLVSHETRQGWMTVLDKGHLEGLRTCTEMAELCWKRVLEIEPGDYRASVFLGQLCEDLGFYRKAARAFDRAVAKTEEERKQLISEKAYLRERMEQDLDTCLRPSDGTAVARIHDQYGTELNAVLDEIEAVRRDLLDFGDDVAERPGRQHLIYKTTLPGVGAMGEVLLEQMVEFLTIRIEILGSDEENEQYVAAAKELITGYADLSSAAVIGLVYEVQDDQSEQAFVEWAFSKCFDREMSMSSVWDQEYRGNASVEEFLDEYRLGRRIELN